MNRRRFALGAVFAGAFRPALAFGPPRASSGDAFAADGVEIRLADILAPQTGEPAEPYAEESRAALQALLARSITIQDVAPRDRWGRRVAHVFVGEGAARTSIQALLVETGAARVAPETDASTFLGRLLATEAEARAAKKGLWRNWRYSVFDASKANSAVGAFSLVEGVVLETYAGRNRTYLNFGEDYRKDFTVTASSRLARKWKEEGPDLISLAGARIRARGYVAWINGPSIEANNPMQIEVLEIR